LLSSSGFDVRETPKSGDFGADIIASKDDLSFAIQCKDTIKPVGVKAVQEAASAKSHYKVDFAVVCSTARFTDAAIELATSNNVILSNSKNLAARLDTI
jgi:HJR/Mrr/RecB family endonuclease